MSRRGKSTEAESRLVVVRGWDEGAGICSNGLTGTGFYLAVMKMCLEVDSGDGCRTL